MVCVWSVPRPRTTTVAFWLPGGSFVTSTLSSILPLRSHGLVPSQGRSPPTATPVYGSTLSQGELVVAYQDSTPVPSFAISTTSFVDPPSAVTPSLTLERLSAIAGEPNMSPTLSQG